MTWRPSSLGLIEGILVLVLSAGCGQILDIPRDPTLAPAGPWRCLASPAAASPSGKAAVTKPTAVVRVQPCNFITDCTTAVSGLTAQLCDKRDVGCVNPRLVNLTEADGEFRFEVPTVGGGFAGYLAIDSPVALCTDAATFGAVAGKALCGLVAPSCDVAAPDARCTTKIYAPSMLFFNPPILDDMPGPMPVQMFPISGLPTVLAAAGLQIDPEAGNLLIQALDCDGRPATGVTYRVQQFEDQVRPLYVQNGIVSSAAGYTDTAGLGGFVSVPPGFVSVVGYTVGGTLIGSVGVQASPSVLTYTTLLPSVAP